ncbi:hypothetical protein I204_06297 [Kwoniella mangroviensis CBS 8886]|nr:hypothetical protein I204_06297 [Kwoniella mangroviensis CBS 8886]
MVQYTRATAPSKVGGRPNVTTIIPTKSSTHNFYDLFNSLQVSPPSFTTSNIQTDFKAEVEEDYSTGSDHSLERGHEVDKMEGVYQDDRKKVVGRGIVGETSYDDGDNKDDIEMVEAEEEEVESSGGSEFCLGDEGSSGSEGMSEEEEVKGTGKFGGKKPTRPFAPTRVGGRLNVSSIDTSGSFAHTFDDLFHQLHLPPPCYTPSAMQPHIKTEMEDWISRQDDAMDCDATHQVEDNVSEYEEVFKKVKEEDKGGDISSVKDADGEDSYDNSKLDIMLVDQQEEEYCSGSEFCLVDESSSESDGSLGEDDESEESSDVLTHAKKDKKGKETSGSHEPVSESA